MVLVRAGGTERVVMRVEVAGVWWVEEAVVAWVEGPVVMSVCGGG